MEIIEYTFKYNVLAVFQVSQWVVALLLLY